MQRRTTWVRRLVGGGIAIAGLVAGHTLAATPAGAVPGLTRVTKSTASNSNTVKRVEAVCPVGTRVVSDACLGR